MEVEQENKKQKEIEDRTQGKLEGNGEERRRFLVIYNISKRNNIKDLCWTAGAHCFEVLYVSASNIEDLHLQLPISFGLKVTQFRKIAECKQFLVSLGVPLIGIEIIEGARSVIDNPFTEAIAVMPGNEGTGMSEKQKSVCDGYVYIPQYGAGTASLNVNVATGIILHRYARWRKSRDENGEASAAERIGDR